MTHTTMGTMHKNLDLARELTAHFVSEMYPLHPENEQIESLLDGGDEYELNPLPGESLGDVVNNLKMVQTLASEPVPMPKIEHDWESDHYEATLQRDQIRLFSRAALALLEVPHHG